MEKKINKQSARKQQLVIFNYAKLQHTAKQSAVATTMKVIKKMKEKKNKMAASCAMAARALLAPFCKQLLQN